MGGPELMELTDRERDIFEARRSPQPISRAELGLKYGVTAERIRQIEARAIAKVEGTTMITTTMTKPVRELPPDLPQPIIKVNTKTARVRLTRDIWPNVKLTKGERLYAGQVVPLPIEDARSVVEYKQGVLVFDEPTDNEAIK